jgi:hypothetical protein
MKKFIQKFLVPAFMLFVLLKPHAERIAFQGGFTDGAQYTQIQFEGTFGLPVPSVQLMNNDVQLTDNRLELNSETALFSFTAGETVKNGTVITLQTKIDAVSLQSETSFRSLPYDIYETLENFELSTVNNSVSTVSQVTRFAVPSYNQQGLSAEDIEGFLTRFNIPITFSRDEISEALQTLSDSELATLVENNMINDEGRPMWSVATVAELDIELVSGMENIQVTYPLFPGYSEMNEESEMASAFCSDTNTNGLAAAHHMIDFTSFENLSEVVLRSGNREQSATCLKGSRSNLANSYTISGPGLDNNGLSEVLFVKS